MSYSSQFDTYKKNQLLIIIFLVLISISLLIGLFYGYKYTLNGVENNFSTKKVEILDKTIKPYNDFLFIKIPQISFYQGFLNSSSFLDLSKGYFKEYPFISGVTFYDIEINNHIIENGFSYGDKTKRFSLGVKAIYYNKPNQDSIRVLFSKNGIGKFGNEMANSFTKLVIKFVDYIATADTFGNLNSDRIFKLFYTVNPGEISYLNVPRQKEFAIYKGMLMSNVKKQSPSYDNDLFTFEVNPNKLEIINQFPKLYEKILIRPLGFDSLSLDGNYQVTAVPLPGGFSNYQLYFISSNKFINSRVIQLFQPIAIAILSVYGLLMIIGFLIFRNFNTNSKLFKLQYDFINNLTHEFKTPVSVIKIAGNNIRNVRELSDSDRQLYGKILDEEADKLNDLMNRLLSLTQIENKSIRLKFEEINLPKFCQDMVDAYQIKFPDYKITYEVDERIKYFESDKIILTSIFQNLMDNAYKYSPIGKKELFLKIRLLKKQVFLQFIDKGIGIPKSEIDNIFKKFYKVESEFNQQGSAGIGLAFCKEIINFMDGEIKVRSKVGEGSEFRIVLPLENPYNEF